MPREHHKPGVLAEWVAESMGSPVQKPVQVQRQKAAAPNKALPGARTLLPKPQVRLKDHPRYLTLRDWAEQMFGDAAPHENTLLRWCKDGRIYPLPRKIGKRWWVEPHAEYVD